ncbi:hypothetical protein PCASD_26795 [Puccinia coronata f. sp. avenae]|uniref:Uncharacterized protein n=1 Tax=Puccinia coronata f. sp. avenae TaxID=200324 RepID=A0A2N5TKB7_9BASI|nr:hypothetical protein PCASD_26795 [Puccinia coronata f. sp. avenae]
MAAPNTTIPFLTTNNAGTLQNKVIPTSDPNCLVPNYTNNNAAPSTDKDKANKQVDYNKDSLDYNLKDQTLLASSLTPPGPGKGTASRTTDLAAQVKAMTLPQIERENHWKDSAMEINQPLNLLADTRIHPSSKANLLEDTCTHSLSNTNKDDDLEVITHKDTEDVTLLTKPKKIQCLVKEHIAIRDKFLQAQKVNNTLKMKTMLFKAQESQKSLRSSFRTRKLSHTLKGGICGK